MRRIKADPTRNAARILALGTVILAAIAFLASAQVPEAAAAASRTVILGRPTDRSIAASVMSDQAVDAYLEYGLSSGSYGQRTPEAPLPANQPVEFEIASLMPDTPYYYRLRYRPAGAASFAADAEASFHTQRAPGSTFVFGIQADTHPERLKSMFDPTLYGLTLGLAANDRPDFYISLGDDFSVDTMKSPAADTVAQLYVNQRNYLAPVGKSAPLFLVNGNHEQAAAYLLDGTPNNMAVWAQTARNKYFAEPVPDGFYTGDQTPVAFIGALRDYYAWTWGDALFVVLDPYWHSPVAVDNDYYDSGKSRDMWAITLGEDQYRWFQRTLAQSRAKYKFVFAHHVNGTGRGGVEVADLYEWGGKGANGSSDFAAKRPGWEKPIHPLMAQYGVSIFFQGHDHLFCKQALNGIIYQECPIPADYTYTAFNADAYTSGVTFPNTGYLRVTVSSADVKVEYVRSYLPADESGSHRNGEVAYSYSLFGKSKTGGIRR